MGDLGDCCCALIGRCLCEICCYVCIVACCDSMKEKEEEQKIIVVKGKVVEIDGVLYQQVDNGAFVEVAKLPPGPVTSAVPGGKVVDSYGVNNGPPSASYNATIPSLKMDSNAPPYNPYGPMSSAHPPVHYPTSPTSPYPPPHHHHQPQHGPACSPPPGAAAGPGGASTVSYMPSPYPHLQHYPPPQPQPMKPTTPSYPPHSPTHNATYPTSPYGPAPYAAPVHTAPPLPPPYYSAPPGGCDPTAMMSTMTSTATSPAMAPMGGAGPYTNPEFTAYMTAAPSSSAAPAPAASWVAEAAPQHAVPLLHDAPGDSSSSSAPEGRQRLLPGRDSDDSTL